jgi:AcrR family transcriptional regulator
MTTDATSQRGRAPRHPRADGERTRGAILRAAASLATVEGLEGLSIGNLAAAIGMSKSGLYAHFGSKEELQLATVAEAERILAEEVVQPALAARPGLGQLAAACEAFFSYVERRVFPGGCFFAAPARSRTGSPPSTPASPRCSPPSRPPRSSSTSSPPARTPAGSPSSCTPSCWAPTPNSSSTTTRPSWTWAARSSASG